LQDIYSQLITIQSALDKALTKTQYIALSWLVNTRNY
jgi:hypothetical protein